MVASGTLELAKNGGEQKSSFPLGSLVEVTYMQPGGVHSLTYLGTVAMRPEDKALMSVVTNKFGEERIIPHAETYTIKTLEKTHNYFLEDTDAILGQRVSKQVPPVDLIFDPTNDHFHITAAELVIPASR